MKTLSTTNYELFKANPFQRTFSHGKVKEIAIRMKENGFPQSMAISVYRHKNGDLIINTGHHRLAAAKSLGIPVLYVIESQWTLKQLVDEGVTGSNWKQTEAAQTFARSGMKSYQDLLAYADKGIPLGMAASLLIGEGAGSGNAKSSITNGTFKIKTKDRINKIVALFERFGETIPAVFHRPFISCYSKCLLTKEFDEEVFISRLKANPTMLIKTSTDDQMLSLIEEIYNFRSAKKIPLAFIVRENSKSRKDSFGKIQ